MATTYTFTTKLSVEECKERIRQNVVLPFSSAHLSKILWSSWFTWSYLFIGRVKDNSFWVRRLAFLRPGRGGMSSAFTKAFVASLRAENNTTYIEGLFKFRLSTIILMVFSVLLASSFVIATLINGAAKAALFIFLFLVVMVMWYTQIDRDNEEATIDFIKQTLEATG